MTIALAFVAGLVTTPAALIVAGLYGRWWMR